MVSRWYAFNDRKLAQLEQMGAPSWVITAAAYLLGMEIAAYFAGHRS